MIERNPTNLLGKEFSVPEAPVFKPSQPGSAMTIHFAIGTSAKKKKMIARQMSSVVKALQQEKK